MLRQSLDRLADPFAPEDVEWRIQTSGEKSGKIWARVLAYITNRAIMDRLDAVAGPENWQNEYKEGPAGGVICGISIHVLPASAVSAQWITKWDGAENSDIESVKGGLSNSMKRAAVQWGMGRYLYDLEEGWAQVHDGGRFSAKTKDGKWFKWDPPVLPDWAQPKERTATTEQLAELAALSEQVDEASQKRVARLVAAKAPVSEARVLDAIKFLKARVAEAQG
jgi:hypothetical protein